MTTLKNKRVVVIGGSTGMGLGIAQATAAQGAFVVIVGTSPDKLEGARQKVGENALVMQANITDETAMQTLFDQIESLDHLAITASPGSRGEFLNRSIKEARSYMDGKFWGTYQATYYAVPKMPETGSITFLSGGLAIRPQKGTTVVTSAFAAVEALGKALAVELAPLRVNTIRPGMIDSPLWSFMSPEEREKMYAESAKTVPARRVGQPEDIGHAAVFLMTNPFVTGTVVEVNGGSHLI